jgi:uncharacterized protein (TIGR02466 family)
MTEVHTLNAFTAPIFALRYDNSESLKQEVVPVFKEIEKSDDKPFYYDNGYTSYNPKSNILELDELFSFNQFVNTSIEQVHDRLNLNSRVAAMNSWFSIGRKNSMHEKHNHLPSVWSGTYYVQAENDDGNITFFNEHLKSNWPFCETGLEDTYTRQLFTIQPETGLLLIFPSYLEHQVHLNKTDNERIAISFNYGNLI